MSASRLCQSSKLAAHLSGRCLLHSTLWYAPATSFPARHPVSTYAAQFAGAKFDDEKPKSAKPAYLRQPKPQPGRGSGKGPNSQRGGPKRPVETTPLDDEPKRLAKVMAVAGVASRRACEALIDAGKVSVNGKVVTQQGTLVNALKDRIQVEGKVLALKQLEHYYFLVNKPKGYICSNVEAEGKEGSRVVDLLKPWLEAWQRKRGEKAGLPPRLFTVGRLDVASHGMILVTNDGQWAQKVIHPSANLTKEYIVMVNKAPSLQQLERMMEGVEIDGVKVAPEEVGVLEESVKLRVVVSEGKKHEVRLLVASAGLEVMSLKRTRIGGLRIPRDLGLGGYAEMTKAQIRAVTDLKAQEKLEAQAAGLVVQPTLSPSERIVKQITSKPRVSRRTAQQP